MGPSFDPGYLVRVMLHCNTKLIWQPNHASADSNDGSTDIAASRDSSVLRGAGVGGLTSTSCEPSDMALLSHIPYHGLPANHSTRLEGRVNDRQSGEDCTT